MELTFGADPELFLKKGRGFRSSHGIIPGTKEQPHPVKSGAVQVDGMALEFNIDPAKTAPQFVRHIRDVMQELRRMVPDDYEFAVVPVARFHHAHMKAQPEDALILGCEPDYNAWTGKVNPRPNQHPTMRTAAGHLHVGWKKKLTTRS